MEVSLPANLNRKTMYELISQIVDDDREPLSNDIKFLFQDLKFVGPVGVTVLSNFTQWLIKKGVKVAYTTPSMKHFENNVALCYLDDSLYFERYLGQKMREEATPRPTTVPLTLVRVVESYQWFQKIVYWLSARLGVTPESLANLKTCLQEIFNNINDHSTENIGCAFIQHYPQKNTVTIAISDFGVGIPTNIQALHPSLNDAQAIKVATQEGFSTKSTPRNRGAGLITLIDNVVLHNKGSVYIHSNYGILECKNEHGEISMSSRLKRTFYPGTLIEINLKTDTIENIEDDEEDFEW